MRTLPKQVPVLGHKPVKSPPDGRATGDVQQRGKRPKHQHATREIPDDIGSRVATSLAVNDYHLAH